MGSKRKTPGINGSSSADIAFMLLIFFLITTSMDTDKGLARRLPPPVPKDQKKNDVDVNKRNLVVVLINSSNQILFNGEPTDIKQLKDKVKEFIDNPYNDANKPEKVEEDVPFFGKVMTAKKLGRIGSRIHRCRYWFRNRHFIIPITGYRLHSYSCRTKR